MMDRIGKHLESLKEFNHELTKSEFEDLSRNTNIGIVFDSKDLIYENLQLSLDITVNLLSRLYNNIGIFDLNSAVNHDVIEKLSKDVNLISDEIQFFDDISLCKHMINFSDITFEGINTIYVKSNNWDVNVVRDYSKLSVDWGIKNPLSALYSSSVAVGEVFKDVFDKVKSQRCEELKLSLYDYSSDIGKGPEIHNVHLDDICKIGIGAVGNAFVYTISKFDSLTGSIALIDKETIDESNTQRYLLSNKNNIHEKKVIVAKTALDGFKLKVEPYFKTVGEYIYEVNPNSKINNAVVSIDNYKGRVQIQGLLPKNIFNAYTEDNGFFGVTTHKFGDGPCLACLYTKKKVEKSDIEQFAQCLGVNDVVIGNFICQNELGFRQKFTSTHASIIIEHSKKGVTMDDLKPYIGKSFDEFSAKAMCGGLLLLDETQEAATKHSPVAHQSVLSGILLANEVVKQSILGQSMCESVQIRISVLSNYDNTHITRSVFAKSDSCICNDDIYLEVYKDKYGS